MPEHPKAPDGAAGAGRPSRARVRATATARILRPGDRGYVKPPPLAENWRPPEPKKRKGS